MNAKGSRGPKGARGPLTQHIRTEMIVSIFVAARTLPLTLTTTGAGTWGLPPAATAASAPFCSPTARAVARTTTAVATATVDTSRSSTTRTPATTTARSPALSTPPAAPTPFSRTAPAVPATMSPSWSIGRARAGTRATPAAAWARLAAGAAARTCAPLDLRVWLRRCHCDLPGGLAGCGMFFL